MPPTCPQGARGPLHSRYPEWVTCLSGIGTFFRRQNRPVLELFPDTARIDGAAPIGGVAAAELVRAHGSPLVVYDAETLWAAHAPTARPRRM